MRALIQPDRRRENGLHHRNRCILAAAAMAGLMGGARTALAASAWVGPSGTTSVPTTGFWNTAANWSPAGVPAGGTAQELDFLGGSTAYTSTDDITGAFSLNTLVLGDAGSTIASSVPTNTLSFGGTNPTINQTTAGVFTISAPVAVTANTAITQVNGGEIDFTGPVTAAGSNALILSNASGTGNATVKFTGSNTFSGLTVPANVTAVSGLTGNGTTLGSGSVTLAGGTLLLQGKQSAGTAAQQTIGVTGFNADTIIDAAASTTIAANASTGVVAHTANATAVDPTLQGGSTQGSGYTSSTNILTKDLTSTGTVHNRSVLTQNGWNGLTTGVTATGLFTSTASALGTNHQFNFAYNGTTTNFANNNTLYFTNGSGTYPGTTDMTSKTLTLATPSPVKTLDFLADSYAGSTFDVVLNFTDMSSSNYSSAIVTGTVSAPTNLAYTVNSENQGNSNLTNNGGPIKFDESDLTLSTADQAKTLASITFVPTSITTVSQGYYAGGQSGGVGTAEIYAVSGIALTSGVLQASQTYANNLTLTADSAIDVSGSLTATMGTLTTGNKLSVTSASTTLSPYSLTLGAVSLTGNASFLVANSAGGGVGTLNLGGLNDGGTAKTVTVNANTGTVALTAAATSLVSGSTLNVLGTINASTASAWAGSGTVINVNGGTLNLNAADALGTVTGGIVNINSGTVNGAVANAATLAQVNMTGGTFVATANQQISSLNGTTGTVSLQGAALVVGNSIDNLSSTFGGQILGTTIGNFSGALGKSGAGTLTLTGGSNTQIYTEINQGGITVAVDSAVNNGVISGPFGNGIVLVGDGGSTADSALMLDNHPGRTLYNTVYYASGPHGSGSTGTSQQSIGALNTSGITTFAGDIVLGSGSVGGAGTAQTTGTDVLGASNGGEVDVTGNLIANHDVPLTTLTVRNLSGTGSAIVKTLGQNNTYRGGTEIDPNVTFVSPLSQSTRTLGYGSVMLAGGTLALQGQQSSGAQLSNLVTNSGFNQMIIAAAGNGTPASSLSKTTSTIDGGSVLYEKGYVNSAGVTGPTGLASSGLFTSEYNPSVQFQLQPYAGNTALEFKNGNNSTGTLALATPGAFKTINLLSMNGPANIAVTFNFSDSSSETQYLTTQQWYYGQSGPVPGGAAVNATQRLAVGGPNTNGGEPAQFIGSVNRSATADTFTEYPASMYEDDFTLAAGDQTKTLTSISFNASAASLTALGGSSANIMAVSGQAYVAPVTLTTQTYVNNVNLTNTNNPTGTINVSGSLNAVMGNNLQLGTGTLSVVSSDASGNPYSLTLGTLPDTLDNLGTAPAVSLLGNVVGGGPTFNVSNSAGGGTGTVVLGALDDHLALDPILFTPIVQTITKTGAGSLTLSAPAASLQAGTVFNVSAGTVNSNDPTAMGTASIANVTGTGTLKFGANDNTGTAPVLVTLAGLNIGATAKALVLDATSHADRTVLLLTGTNTLSIATGGALSLNGNDMIVQGGDLPTITAELKSGFSGGAWNGSGIRSITASNDSTHLTTLGVMSSAGNSFDGQSTNPGDVLVKYTYYGDANLDGKVDASDYSLIDSGFVTSATGWSNGDFNYDGVINGSDYTLIDNAFNTQGASLAAAFASPDATPTAEIGGTSAVPEPTTLSLLGIGAAGLLGRRSRRRL